MAMKSWARMLDDIAPDLPQCPIDLIQHHLRRATISLCEDSQVYRVNSDAVDLVAGEASVDMDLPSQTELVQVVLITFDGVEVKPLDIGTLQREQPRWRTQTGSAPQYYYGNGDDSISVYPIPDTSIAGKLYATVAVRPIETADGIEAWVYRKYGDGIVGRAKAELKAMLNKPWSDRGAVGAHEAAYMAKVATAISDAARSQSNTPRRSVPQYI